MKPKKILSLILAAVVVLSVSFYASPAPVLQADTEENESEDVTYTSQDGNYEYSILEDGTVSLLHFYGSPVSDESTYDNVTALPDTIDGKVVSKVCSTVFQENTNDAGMQTTILILPSRLQSIEPFFISQMELLTKIKIDDSNEFYATKDGILYDKDITTLIRAPRCLNSLDDSSYMIDYVIPDSVKKISDEAFSLCIGFNSVTIPDSVSNIGSNVFRNVPNLTAIEVSKDNQSYTSQDGVLYTTDKKTLIAYPIGLCNVVSDTDDPFGGTPDPINFVVPEGVETIADSAFYNCTSSTNYNLFGLASITFPSSLKTIEPWAFANCYNLTSVNFPKGLEKIDDMAFMFCVGLTSVEIPDTVTWIGSYAFDNCKALKKATIPSNVTHLGDSCIGFMDDTTTFDPVPIDGFTLYCEKGSAAEAYAKEMNLVYEIHKTDATPSPTPTAVISTPAPTKKPDDSPSPVAPTEKTAASPSATPAPVKQTKPAKPTWTSLKSTKKKTLTAKWKKAKKADGYQVQYSLSKKFKKAKTKTVTANKITIRSLKRKKTYYVKIRSFARNEKTKTYSSWSKVKKIKVK